MKDWTKEDNFAEFEKAKEARKRKNEAGMINELVGRAAIMDHPRKQVGAVTEKFKRNATPEQMQALKNVRHDNQDRAYV